MLSTDRLRIEHIPYLARLSVDQRESLVLIAVRGLTYEQAAIELGLVDKTEFQRILDGTVKSRVHRARTALLKLVTMQTEITPEDQAAVAKWNRARYSFDREAGNEVEHALTSLARVTAEGGFYKDHFNAEVSGKMLCLIQRET